jgi:hypothetical protein
VGTGNLTEEPTGPVSVGTVFDRFPASVRGAVVITGGDREPHQVRLLRVRVVQAHDISKEIRRASVEETTVDVAPHGEVLIPFDVSFTETGPGWFCVTAEVEVDGALRVTGPDTGGKRFGVPWPTEEIRRMDRKPSLKVGGAVIERIQSKPDRTEVRWRPPKRGPDAELRVTAGRQRLPVVEVTDDVKSGIRTTIAHPVPRRATQLALEVGRGRRRASTILDLAES